MNVRFACKRILMNKTFYYNQLFKKLCFQICAKKKAPSCVADDRRAAVKHSSIVGDLRIPNESIFLLLNTYAGFCEIMSE